jgi:hypothetical protein
VVEGEETAGATVEARAPGAGDLNVWGTYPRRRRARASKGPTYGPTYRPSERVDVRASRMGSRWGEPELDGRLVVEAASCGPSLRLCVCVRPEVRGAKQGGAGAGREGGRGFKRCIERNRERERESSGPAPFPRRQLGCVLRTPRRRGRTPAAGGSAHEGPGLRIVDELAQGLADRHAGRLLVGVHGLARGQLRLLGRHHGWASGSWTAGSVGEARARGTGTTTSTCARGRARVPIRRLRVSG